MRRRGGAALTALSCLGRLPAVVLALLGYTLGLLVFPLSSRRKVVLRNLEACFPERGWLWRMQLLVRYSAFIGRFFVDHCMLIGAGAKRIKNLVRLEGSEHLQACRCKPIILAAPHFQGMTFGGARIGLEIPLMLFHKLQHGNLSRAIMDDPITNIGIQSLANDEQAIAKMVRGTKNGKALYYLPDIDLRNYAKYRFVPFLGVPQTATLTAISRLAKITNAVVLPCITVMRPLGGYQMIICAPLEGFPSGDVYADLRRYNEVIGEWVRRYPTQYYWAHRRFKTRPPGEECIYA